MSEPKNNISGSSSQPRCTVFRGNKKISQGLIGEIADSLYASGNLDHVLIFDDETAQQIDIDLRGTKSAVLARLEQRFPGDGQCGAAETAVDVVARPGRPKLGVVAREVTLLPRHWDWLAGQPGGASVALRKLVEEARRASGSRDQVRKSQEAAYRFMSAMAGNEAGFEEATRALFARDSQAFELHTASWPKDVRLHAKKFAAPVFAQ